MGGPAFAKAAAGRSGSTETLAGKCKYVKGLACAWQRPAAGLRQRGGRMDEGMRSGSAPGEERARAARAGPEEAASPGFLQRSGRFR